LSPVPENKIRYTYGMQNDFNSYQKEHPMKKRIIWTLGVTCLLHLSFVLYLTLQPTVATKTELPDNATVLSEETSFTGHVGQATTHTPIAFIQSLFVWSIPLTIVILYILLTILHRLRSTPSS